MTTTSIRSSARRPVLALALVAALVGAACSGGDSAASITDTSPTATEAAPADPEPDPEPAPDPEPEQAPDPDPEPEPDVGSETEPEPASWERVVPGGDCECSDGSEFAFFVRDADPTKVVLYFQGGGACFDEFTCDPALGTYLATIDASADPSTGGAGIFDFDDARNPIADHSVVFVPYCTGDVHLGNTTTAYSDTLTVAHKGFVNASAAMEHLVERFPDAATIVVSGESAGSIPTPLFAGLLSDVYPDADITALGDGSGGYPDNPIVNAIIGELWGTFDVVPDWPVNETLTPEDWGIPRVWVQAGLHAPTVRFGRIDFAFDDVQAAFLELAGFGIDNVLDAIELNDAQIRDAGISLLTYTAPGDEHTVLRRPAFYTLEVEGVPLHDWVRDVLAGAPVTDVRCTVCD